MLKLARFAMPVLLLLSACGSDAALRVEAREAPPIVVSRSLPPLGEAVPTTTTTAPPAPTTTVARKKAVVAPKPVVAAAARPSRAIDWDAISECEDNDNPAKGTTGWASNTGNGYYGGLQFDWGTWKEASRNLGVPPGGLPHTHSREDQIAHAATLPLSRWPYCKRFG